MASVTLCRVCDFIHDLNDVSLDRRLDGGRSKVLLKMLIERIKEPDVQMSRCDAALIRVIDVFPACGEY